MEEKREVIYRTDNIALNQLKEQMKEQQNQYIALLKSKDEQYKSTLLFYQNESQRREKENKELLNTLMRNEQKSEEIVKNTFLLLKDSEIQHQK